MNKAELIDVLTEKLGSDRRQATAAVEHVVDTIVRAVHKGDSVTITGFGVFEQRKRAARVARNPRTGETVKVKPTSVPAFRPGAQFKAVVSGAQRLPSEGPAVKRGVGWRWRGQEAAVKKAVVKKARQEGCGQEGRREGRRQEGCRQEGCRQEGRARRQEGRSSRRLSSRRLRPPSRRRPSRRPSSRRPRPPSRRLPSKKAVVKKAAPAVKKAAVKKAVVKKAAARKAPAKKGRK